MVFGFVRSGMEVVKEIERVGSLTGHMLGSNKVLIADCGEYKEDDDDANPLAVRPAELSQSAVVRRAGRTARLLCSECLHTLTYHVGAQVQKPPENVGNGMVKIPFTNRK